MNVQQDYLNFIFDPPTTGESIDYQIDCTTVSSTSIDGFLLTEDQYSLFQSTGDASLYYYLWAATTMTPTATTYKTRLVVDSHNGIAEFYGDVTHGGQRMHLILEHQVTLVFPTNPIQMTCSCKATQSSLAPIASSSRLSYQLTELCGTVLVSSVPPTRYFHRLAADTVVSIQRNECLKGFSITCPYPNAYTCTKEQLDLLLSAPDSSVGYVCGAELQLPLNQAPRSSFSEYIVFLNDEPGEGDFQSLQKYTFDFRSMAGGHGQTCQSASVTSTGIPATSPQVIPQTSSALIGGDSTKVTFVPLTTTQGGASTKAANCWSLCAERCQPNTVDACDFVNDECFCKVPHTTLPPLSSENTDEKECTKSELNECEQDCEKRDKKVETCTKSQCSCVSRGNASGLSDVTLLIIIVGVGLCMVCVCVTIAIVLFMRKRSSRSGIIAMPAAVPMDAYAHRTSSHGRMRRTSASRGSYTRNRGSFRRAHSSRRVLQAHASELSAAMPPRTDIQSGVTASPPAHYQGVRQQYGELSLKNSGGNEMINVRTYGGVEQERSGAGEIDANSVHSYDRLTSPLRGDSAAKSIYYARGPSVSSSAAASSYYELPLQK